MSQNKQGSEKGERQDLGERTKAFALAAIRTYVKLPKTPVAQVIGRQLLRSGTSVGAHWREARRARSDAEFVSKVEGGLQELDETCYWLELLAEAGVVEQKNLKDLLREANELTSIYVACVKKTKGRAG
jgi:four helix bundle protein